MNCNRRRIVALMVVTAALCADHTCLATPASSRDCVEMSAIPSQLVSRLARSLRGVVPVAALRTLLCDERATVRVGARLCMERPTPPASRLLLMPFQFRLPPPIC